MAVIEEYLAELTESLRGVLGGDLVGVYAGGSYALGAYDAGRSDLDVAAVVRASLAYRRKRELVERVRHEALPCPARKLELVVYRLEAARRPSARAAFELNLNSGAGIPERVDYEPDPEEEHWFPIDRSILAAAGVALAGLPAREVFAPIPREGLLRALEQALAWQLAHDEAGPDVVLNACRALRFAREGTWSGKREAGAWALTVGSGSPPVVAEAIRARAGDGQLDVRAVRRFVAEAAGELRARSAAVRDEVESQDLRGLWDDPAPGVRREES